MFTTPSGSRFLRFIGLFTLLIVSGCSQYTHVDPYSSKLYTEAESAMVDGSWPIWVTLKDSKKNLAELRPIPETAYIWNSSKVYKLFLKGAYFDHGQYTTPKNNQADAISFKFYGTDSSTTDPTPPLDRGTYNISIQLNGTEGINTLCGSFKIVTETHTINGADLH